MAILQLSLLFFLLHIVDATPQLPLTIVSTVDGTLSGYDANTGAQLFTYHERPTITTVSFSQRSEYIPSVDGLLYRIDHKTAKAHVLPRTALKDDTLLGVTPDGEVVFELPQRSSVLLVHLRSGRVTQLSSKFIPWSSAHIAIYRTTVGVSVADFALIIDLAFTTVRHNIPYKLPLNRCPSLASAGVDSDFVASISGGRDRLTVKSKDGETLWCRNLQSSIFETYGLGGVRIARWEGAAGDPSVSRKGSFDVLVAQEGGIKYAMLPPRKDSTSGAALVSGIPGWKVQKYRVANVDAKALPNADRPFAVTKQPLPEVFITPAEEEAEGPSIGALVFLALKLAVQFGCFILFDRVLRSVETPRAVLQMRNDC